MQTEIKSVEKQVEEYFMGMGLNDPAKLKLAIQTIRSGVFASEEDITYIKGRFSPQYREAIAKFIQLFEAEIDAWAKEEERIIEEIYKLTQELNENNDPIDEFNEYDGFQIHYPSRIEVRGNVTGLGDRIPKKNRKYIGGKGNMIWEYPFSMRDELSKLRDWLPIIEAKNV